VSDFVGFCREELAQFQSAGWAGGWGVGIGAMVERLMADFELLIEIAGTHIASY